jgi:hypothetical protein
VAAFFRADLAPVVSITLLAVCAWATFAGSILALLATRAGVDPVVMSAPLTTTLVDATGRWSSTTSSPGRSSVPSGNIQLCTDARVAERETQRS